MNLAGLTHTCVKETHTKNPGSQFAVASASASNKHCQRRASPSIRFVRVAPTSAAQRVLSFSFILVRYCELTHTEPVLIHTRKIQSANKLKNDSEMDLGVWFRPSSTIREWAGFPSPPAQILPAREPVRSYDTARNVFVSSLQGREQNTRAEARILPQRFSHSGPWTQGSQVSCVFNMIFGGFLTGIMISLESQLVYCLFVVLVLK